MKVVVVEDNALSAELVEMLLASEGHEVRIARDGAEFRTLLANEIPDIVLMDMSLPDTTGPELLAATQGALAGVPVLAVTAHAGDASLTSSFAAVITKPIDTRTFAARVAAAARVR